MGRTKDKIVSSFANVIKKKFNPCKVILFGSRATGTYKKDSDYDFLLISSKFNRVKWEDRMTKVYSLKRNIPAAMDIICLTPTEFESKKKGLGVVKEAVREGLEV